MTDGSFITYFYDGAGQLTSESSNAYNGGLHTDEMLSVTAA